MNCPQCKHPKSDHITTLVDSGGCGHSCICKKQPKGSGCHATISWPPNEDWRGNLSTWTECFCRKEYRQ